MTTITNLDQNVWTDHGDIHVRGHAFYDGQYVDSSGLGALVEDTDGIEELSSLLSDLNGFYTVVIDGDDETVLAADRMRTGPVFYANANGDFLVSDDCGWLIENVDNLTRSEVSEIEYETARIVTASNTLYDEISQLQSGEILVFDEADGSVSTHQHHVHTVTESKYSVAQLKEEFDRVLDAAFNRLVDLADGRPIVVPLSGGYDSRLIALMLKRVGYENVITYTVDTGGETLSIAKRIADNLGYSWVTAEETHSEWNDYYKSNEWDSYFDKAAYLGSLPHPTGILALQKLKMSGQLPKDGIFIPGHSALDSMKATPIELENKNEVDIDQLSDLIINKHFKYNEHTSIPEQSFSKRLSRTLGLGTPHEPESLVEAFERWRLKERRSKLIINGNRIFDLFGYDWWMPLEDQKVYEFWRKVPIEQKRHRSFYEKFIEDLYVEVGEVSPNEANTIADTNVKSTISNLIRGLPIETIIRRSYGVWDESWLKYWFMRFYKLDGIYESDPRFGIMSKEKLKEVYKGQSYPFFSLLALATTGKVDLHE